MSNIKSIVLFGTNYSKLGTTQVIGILIQFSAIGFDYV